ncbi:MAG TPA: sorbitol-6-phosphate dehydrogenase [Clostridia bacterium]|nr:sorbitol-6-phosphate dehydrogenase [Clostridia bacterium]
MFTLKDQVAIVAGGGQGLGQALCMRLHKEGAKVIVGDINLDAAKETAELLGDASAVKVDVTDYTQCADMVQKAVKLYGKVDLLISNAAILIAKGIDEFTSAEWQKVMDVNLVGFFNCAKAVSQVMMDQGQGNIIQINSKSGKKGSFKNSAYAASKFGGIGLAQSLALELAPHNIRVNAICPGNLLDSPLWVNSLYEQYAKNQGITKEEVRQKYLDQVPLGRGCTYDDVANTMVFLASDQASYMTGQAINVTGGQEMR